MLTLTPPDIARINSGILVEYPPTVLPATTTTAYFTITGWVDLTVFFGVCTTVCSATATNLSAIHVPSSPASVNTTIANTLAIANFDAGSLVAAELDGTAFLGTDGAAGAVIPGNRMRLGPGSISIVTSATNTGAFQWALRYIPVLAGSTVAKA